MMVPGRAIAATSMLVALAGLGEAAPARQPTRFALTCIGTETGGEVHFQFRWGADDTWEQSRVEPGEWIQLTWDYDAPGQNSSPQLQIRYDDDLTSNDNWVVTDLESHAASQDDCEGQGRTYNFVDRESELFVVDADHKEGSAGGPPPDPAPSFSLSFQAPERELTRLVHDVLRRDGEIQADIDLLNEGFALPEPVSITFLDSEAGSFYAPDARSIQVDYAELLEEWQALAGDDPDAPEDEVAMMVVDLAEYALFHEVGHALIHVLGLPVVGREEDAVDSLATVIMLDVLEDPETAITSARMWMLRELARQDEVDQTSLSGAHSLDGQRFGNMACWIVGSAPGEYPELAEEAQLSENRLSGCAEDYARQSDSWQTLLEPHMR